MSFYAVEWALGLDGLKPVTKAVLVALCRHEKGGQCFPSINRLAKVSGFSRNTIIAHLKILEAAGIIARIKQQMENASYDVSITKINMPPHSVRPALPSATDALPPSAEDGRGVAQALHLNTVTIISKNTVADFEAFWSSWRPYDMEKGNKKPALEKYEKITRSGTDPKILLTAAKLYCDSCHRRRSKTQHVITWLHQRGWESAPASQASIHYDDPLCDPKNAII